MYSIYQIGTAGSGKTLLTEKLISLYNDNGNSVASINLDPGVKSLPYTPDVDIREYIDIDSLMEKYQLGPNGALIFAVDLIATKIDEIQNSLDAMNVDYAIFDTPGQIELFAYRNSGLYIVNNIQSEAKVSLFLFDSTLISSYSNYVSLLFLANSIRLKFNLPQIPVFSKFDLIENSDVISNIFSDPETIGDRIESESSGDSYMLNRDLLTSIITLGLEYDPIPVSSINGDGMIDVMATISRTLNLGEDTTYSNE